MPLSDPNSRPLIKHRLKSKFLIRIVISLGILASLWFIVRMTGMVQFYNIPTNGNFPGLKSGDQIFATNLKNYERLDFVCYNFTDSRFPPPSIWVRRICGIPGDTVELKDGTLFVNGKNCDAILSLSHLYFVDETFISQLRSERNCPVRDVESGLIRLAVEDALILPTMKARRFVDNDKGGVHKSFNQAWTLDNFGPFVIPKGFLFLLGDNRHNTVDSRHTGLTAEEDVVGVVVH